MYQLIQRIRGAIRTGTCVPIVGAGVSIPSGGPNWSDYLKKLCDGLPDLFHAMVNLAADPTEVATVLLAKRRELGLPGVDLTVLPGTLHQALAAWRCPLYLTTNFDKALEQAIDAKWGGCDVFTANGLKEFDLNTHMTADARERPAVIKLCTLSAGQHHSVLTREAFAELMHGNSGVLTLLETVLRSYCAVFVGCGIGDPLLNAALDRCFASPLGYPNPIAIMPDNIDMPRRAALEVRRTKILSFDSKEKTVGLRDILKTCATVATGSHRLLIFEPGSMTKLTPVLQGISVLGAGLGISDVGIVTAYPELARELEDWGRKQKPAMTVHRFVVRNVHDKDEVKSAVIKGPRPLVWTSMVAPFELAIEAAAAFADGYREAIGHEFRFHPSKVAALSRNKDKFRQFMKKTYDGHPKLASHAFDRVEIPQGATARQLLDLVRQCPAASGGSVVVKPCNAAGSRGVRPLNLADETDCLNQLNDFLRVMRLLNVNPETTLCDSSSILVEERLDGEEFSVEGRSSGGPVETLAIHWKVDIDADKTRYFERLFVSFPLDTFELAATLSDANTRLLKDMNVGTGVFHSEYRVARDGKRVVPLEVGLRPGGGMVNNSVYTSCGVDLFESSIQCATGQPVSAIGDRRVVATGLVFATTNDGGVIPPLKFEDKDGARSVIHGEPESLRARLRRLVATADRQEALDALKRVLNRKNDICKSVVDAFSPEGTGLQAEVDLVEMWMKPGEFILDEEASYVAGVRVVASRKLEACAAMAEAVAAMELCLSRLKCTPEAPLRTFDWKTLHSKVEQPEWWRRYRDSDFLSDVDSLTFFHGMLRDEPDRLKSVLDLGCGSAKPAIPLVRHGAQYLGVDIDNNAVMVARGNLANIERAEGERPTAQVIHADVRKTSWKDHPAFSAAQWEAVACNLPYLPCPPDSALPISVDGGIDGLDFVPGVPIAAAKALGIKKLIINISSLSNLEEFARRVEDEGYGVTRAVATIAKLEEYSQQVLDYLKDQPFVRLFGSDMNPRQVIYCFTLEPGAGIACDTTIEDIRRALNPDVNSEGTMVVGTSCW